VKVVGERRAPLDLTGLSDNELAFLRRTMLKITASRDGYARQGHVSERSRSQDQGLS
jgi:hypothetical protein